MSTRRLRPRAWQSFTAETCELDGAPAMRFSGPAPQVILPAEAIGKLVEQLYTWLLQEYRCPGRDGTGCQSPRWACDVCMDRGYLVPK